MKRVSIILFLILSYCCNAQDTLKTKGKLEVNGYLKNLESLSFDKNFKNNISGNLLHNRINSKWKPTEKIAVIAEFRNRLFWGEEVKSTPDFVNQLRNDNEQTNLQKAWIKSQWLVLHTNIERLNIAYRDSNWNVRVGRQRINWGITSTWNPNDIFNVYNFLDFDYEERPGVDGSRIQYFINNVSSTEIAYAKMGNKKGDVAAIKYNLNKWGYDMQLNSGWYKEYLTFGAGWAGSIKDAGFKGEAQYFVRGKDTTGQFNLSLEGDYMLKNGWYVNASLLYNNNGLYQPLSNWNNINLKLSPENLMPARLNFMAGTAKEITPLFSVNTSVLYAPGIKLLILLPSLKYNLATNLDADLILQSFFAELNKSFEAVNHRLFLRMKWSF